MGSMPPSSDAEAAEATSQRHGGSFFEISRPRATRCARSPRRMRAERPRTETSPDAECRQVFQDSPTSGPEQPARRREDSAAGLVCGCRACRARVASPAQRSHEAAENPLLLRSAPRRMIAGRARESGLAVRPFPRHRACPVGFEGRRCRDSCRPGEGFVGLGREPPGTPASMNVFRRFFGLLCGKRTSPACRFLRV